MKRRKRKKQRKATAPTTGAPTTNPRGASEQAKAAEGVVIEAPVEAKMSPGGAEEMPRESAAVNKSSARALATPPSAADRRVHPRYALPAAVEVVATGSGEQIQTRLRDLSLQGCYVDTERPFALETAVQARITRGARSFEAEARVVYTRTGSGMGLMFTAVEPGQAATLHGWITEFRETSWLAANRRRSQRVLMQLPVRVWGRDGIGTLFEEETSTLAISAHGALMALSAPVHRGLPLNLSNVQTKAALECTVIHIDKLAGEAPHVGVEFRLPNPTFWHVAFPPKDWTPRHPEAKMRSRSNRSSE